jgi:hypothetical protein
VEDRVSRAIIVYRLRVEDYKEDLEKDVSLRSKNRL